MRGLSHPSTPAAVLGLQRAGLQLLTDEVINKQYYSLDLECAQGHVLTS
jgi:hypothetical protein